MLHGLDQTLATCQDNNTVTVTGQLLSHVLERPILGRQAGRSAKLFLMETYDQKARPMTLCNLAGLVTATTGPATVHRNCTHFPKCWSTWQNRLKSWQNGLQA